MVAFFKSMILVFKLCKCFFRFHDWKYFDSFNDFSGLYWFKSQNISTAKPDGFEMKNKIKLNNRHCQCCNKHQFCVYFGNMYWCEGQPPKVIKFTSLKV